MKIKSIKLKVDNTSQWDEPLVIEDAAPMTSTDVAGNTTRIVIAQGKFQAVIDIEKEA